MPSYDENDPKLAGYKPVEDFRKKDHDRSSRRIRDMPWGRRKEESALNPVEMDFGDVEINSVSPIQTATLTNKGYDDLLIENITVVGKFIITTNCGDSLKSGESCSISAQFNPTHVGDHSGGIYVDTGDAAGDRFIKLLGSGKT